VQAGEFKRCERVGMMLVEVGSTEKTPGMLRLAVPVRVPHNPRSHALFIEFIELCH